MPASESKIGREAVGVYWFVNTETAENLPAARLRMREFWTIGFTEVWIAARYLHDPADARSPFFGPKYKAFLETVAEEADQLGLNIVPLIVPCCFGEMDTPHYDLMLVCSGECDGNGADIDLGPGPENWVGALVATDGFVYRTVAGDLGPRTIDAATVRGAEIRPDCVSLKLDETGRLTARISLRGVQAGEELCVVFRGRPGELVPGLHHCATDVTDPRFAQILTDIVRRHEDILAGRACYAGLAFDEPNINDPSGHPICKRERERRFYWSNALAAAVKRTKGIDLAARPYALARPDTETGYAARVAYFETVQDCLMEAFAEAMKHASVPLMGTHDWSGDRDRAIYNTHDQIRFNGVRQFAATDISGCQWDFDYSASEPFHAFLQKEACHKPRAMLMTDHFGEETNAEWLLFTCERHAAMGIDYMLLHAYGQITHDPPLWTRVESWVAYRQPRALEVWAARMKQLSEFREFRSSPDVLVVYPRTARLVHCGDRYVVREWDRVVFSLARAHFAVATMSQADFGDVEFAGDRAVLHGRKFSTIVFPCFSGLDEAQMELLADFHREGGHVVFTKSNYVFTGNDGSPCAAARRVFEAMLGIGVAPEVRRFKPDEEIAHGGRTYHARRLPDGTSEYDDACLDFGGRLVVESVSPVGGRAVLAGFQVAALSCAEDYHRMEGSGTVAFLDGVLAPLTRRAFTCAGPDGGEDYDVVGLVRERGGELVFTAHRRHEHAVEMRAGGAVVHVPADPPGARARGCSVFVRHAEESVHVVCNPFMATLWECDLGREIASVLDYGGERRYALFEGSRLKLGLPPGREMRFQAIEFGPRDPMLPADFQTDSGRILEAWVPVAGPRRVVVRVNEAETVRLQLSLNAAHGATVTARCVTSAKEAEVSVEERDGRLWVNARFELVPNLENDLEVVQS